MPATERLYCVHGEALRLVTESPAIAEDAATLLAEFSGPDPNGGSSAPLVAALHAVPGPGDLPVTAPALAELVGTAGGDGVTAAYSLYRSEGRWLVDFPGLGLLALDPRAGRLEGWLVAPETMQAEVRAGFVRLAAIELLRLRGLHALHAAAVEKDGLGLIIAGACGRGKTTCCLALLRVGFRCLSDDHPLLRRSAEGLELLPFRDAIDVSERTIELIPELRAARQQFRQGFRKRSFRLEEVFGGSPAHGCRPRYLIFPRVVDRSESYLEPMPRARALEELLPEALLVLDRELAQRQFRLLTHLVQTVACYQLHFGANVLDLPAVFNRTLNRSLACA
jgi:hypothetical protein